MLSGRELVSEPRDHSGRILVVDSEHSPDDPPGVKYAGDPAQDGQEDVDEKVGVAAALKEHADLSTCQCSVRKDIWEIKGG